MISETKSFSSEDLSRSVFGGELPSEAETIGTTSTIIDSHRFKEIANARRMHGQINSGLLAIRSRIYSTCKRIYFDAIGIHPWDADVATFRMASEFGRGCLGNRYALPMPVINRSQYRSFSPKKLHSMKAEAFPSREKFRRRYQPSSCPPERKDHL